MNEPIDEDWDRLRTGQKLDKFLGKNPNATPSEIQQFADKYNINVSFSWSDDTEYNPEDADSEKMCYVAEELRAPMFPENVTGPEKVEDEL